jgi:hypothetical protein
MKSCGNPCIVGALLAYLEDLAVPAPGSSCRREPPFLVVVDEMLLRPQ